jgi:hypothetical protein
MVVGQIVSKMLFGVSAYDPVSLAAALAAAALVASCCPPAPPVESIRSPVCEQTELASSSRYLPLAIGGTCSPILEE